MNHEEVREEINSILSEYTHLVKRFWDLYDGMSDDTADKITQAGEGKWLEYAFTRSMDELYFMSNEWEITENELPN